MNSEVVALGPEQGWEHRNCMARKSNVRAAGFINTGTALCWSGPPKYMDDSMGECLMAI